MAAILLHICNKFSLLNLVQLGDQWLCWLSIAFDLQNVSHELHLYE